MISARNFFILIVICFAVFFINLGQFEPDLMESRNFIAAREMVMKGNWILPTMNDELRLEKQPFVTWLTAFTAIAGNSLTDLSLLRLPAALVSVLMVFFFYGICFELTKSSRFALLGGLIISTSLLVVQMARINSWDVYTHAFMTGSIWLQIKALNKDNNNFKIWIGAALLMGLSVFSKGPVSLYALWLPFIISYIIFFSKDQIMKNGWKLLFMILTALIIGFAWNLYIYLMEPEALKSVLDKETSAWVERHNRPFYFYFHFAVYIGIWTIPLLASFFIRSFRQRINEIGNYKFTLAWILISLFLLSVIPEKKERYMLPMEIPMSLMVTYLVYTVFQAYEKGFATKNDRILFRIQGWLSVVLLLSIPVAAFIILKNDFYSPKYTVGSGVILSMVVYLIVKMKKFETVHSAKLVILSSVLVVVSITSIFLPVVAKNVNKPDFRDVSVISMSSEYKNLEFISEGELNMKLVWRIGKPVHPVTCSTYDFDKPGKVLLFSYFPISEILTSTQVDQLIITDLGTFDSDQSKGSGKIYVNAIESKK